MAHIPNNVSVLVEELIDWNSRTWDLSSISHLISSEVERGIRRIQIGRRFGCDIFIWPVTKNGVFTVRSAYHHIHKPHVIRNTGAGQSHSINNKCWKLLWKLPTFPKVRHFLWRALSSAIPTFLALFKRKIKNSPMCPMCGLMEESMEHILFLCPWVETVWFGSSLGLRIDKQAFTTLDNWFLQFSSSFCIKNDRVWALTMACFLCWSIWKARCNFIYQATPLNPAVIIKKAMDTASDFFGTQCTTIFSKPDRLPATWSPPQIGVVAVNTDACWVDDFKGGFGVIARNHHGILVGGLAGPLRTESALMAEALALLAGVKMAMDLNLKVVDFRSDSKMVISELQSPLTSPCRIWRIAVIIDEIRWRSEYFDHVNWTWSPREANCAAHAAAQLGNKMLGSHNWLETPPPSLTLVLRNDGLPCPHVA
ncbi:uncharacterized protein LOC126783821 [Argentina anserina]|uniref:uncharacterized protein LOC126783821 n=1 Tax=Argentina anserina TaxID=57926 RepID=UPI0021762A9E|nr:uncharacterized protein LOC126783821 [Potentilla anserina]